LVGRTKRHGLAAKVLPTEVVDVDTDLIPGVPSSIAVVLSHTILLMVDDFLNFLHGACFVLLNPSTQPFTGASDTQNRSTKAKQLKRR